MNTVTGWPSARPRRSAEARVMAETIGWPLTSTVTSAMTAPSSTLLTVPLSWLRALICMLTSWVVGAQWSSLSTVVRRAGRRRVQADAGADQGVGGGVVLLVPAASDLVEPAAAGGVAGHVQVGLERLDVQHRGAVEQVDAGELDGGAVDGDHPDQAEGQVVGADRRAGGEQPDPLAGLLEQEWDRPEPVAGERPGALAVGLPGPVEEADEVGVVEPLQAVQAGGVLVVEDQAARLVGVAGGLDRGVGHGPVGGPHVADGPQLHPIEWAGRGSGWRAGRRWHGRPPVVVRRGRW